MQIEKVGDSIRELLEKREFLKMLMGVSDYIIYGYTALIVINQFLSLGGFVNALLGVLLIPLAILAFAGKKYIGLIVLFSGHAFASLYSLMQVLYYTTISRYLIGNLGNSKDTWECIFGVLVFGLLLWLSIALFLANRPAGNASAAPGQPPVVHPNASYQPPVQAQNASAQPYQQPPVPQPQRDMGAAPLPVQSPVAPAPGVPQAPGNPYAPPVSNPVGNGKAPVYSAPTPMPAASAPAKPQAPGNPYAPPISGPAGNGQAPAYSAPAPTPAESAPSEPQAGGNPYAPPVPAPATSGQTPAAPQESGEEEGQTDTSVVTPGVLCSQCGAILPEDMVFCTRCGHRLGE